MSDYQLTAKERSALEELNTHSAELHVIRGMEGLWEMEAFEVLCVLHGIGYADYEAPNKWCITDAGRAVLKAKPPQTDEQFDDDEFSTEFKELLQIAGDDHDLKRAVVRVGKAHTMATVVYKDAKDSNGITQSMWLWRYINDVSMLLKLLKPK